MSFLRRLSTRRLLAVIGGALAVVAGGTAIAIATTSGTPVPAKQPLPVALRQALKAPEIKGVSADHLHQQPSDSQPASGTAGPAPGRLWATADGKARLELQSAKGGGDVQLVIDGNQVSLYEAGSKTLYKATLPAEKRRGGKADRKKGGVPTIANIQRMLKRLGTAANISQATPTSVAGRGAYSVRVSPKRDGGLVGAAQIAWDAVTGTPLRVGIYAADRQDPVLELTATDIAYGDVDSSVFDVWPRPTPGRRPHAAAAQAAAQARPGPEGPKKAKSVAARRRAQGGGFDVSAPRPRRAAPPRRLVTVDGKQAALAVYGKGLGAIAVLQTPVDPADVATKGGDEALKALPEVSIGGVTGHELATALGTVIMFDKGGVSYTILGSVPPAAAEAAARGL